MEYNKFGFQSEKTATIADFLVLPLLAPVFLFVIGSYVVPQTFLLPLMLLVMLSYLALRLPVVAVAFWALVYMGVVLWVSFQNFDSAPTPPALKPYIRTAFVLAGGVTACLLANHRGRLQRSNQALFEVISFLPVAVVLSDVSGNILLMNGKAQRLLEGHLHQLSGLSFFSTFVGLEDQGQAISRYMRYFDVGNEGPHPLVLQTRGEHSLTLDVAISIVTLDKTRYALTVIEHSQETALVAA